jgi:L-asparagine transporter-like permease
MDQVRIDRMLDGPVAVDDFSVIIEREGGLRRTLSARKLSMIAIGGAIGTGLFLGSGFAIGMAGPSVLLSYAIGALIALLLMGCLAEMTVTHPTTGSFGTYAECYVSPLAGFLVRYAYWTCIVLAVGTEVSAVALYMKFWFHDVPGWLWILGFSGILITVNAFSVSTFGTVEYWFSAIKICAIVGFILLAGYLLVQSHRVQTDVADGTLGLRNYTAYGGFLPHGVAGMWVAVIMAIFSYLSIEMIAVAAGEAAQPEVAVTRAFFSTVVRLVLFYILTLALMLALLPWTQAGLGMSPFVRVMQAMRLPAAGGVMNFVILIAALSAMNSQLYISSRMMFSLSRAGQAPRRLGRLTTKGIPLNALLVSSSGIAIATVLSVISPARTFLMMVGISVFGAMFTWLMIFITHYFFRRARDRIASSASRFHMWGFPLTTLLGAGLMAALLITTAFTEAFRMTLVFGLPYLGCLALIYFLRYRGSGVTRV